MRNVSLGEVADFVNGYAFKPSHWEANGKKILRIQNLTDSSKDYNLTTAVLPDKYIVKDGDLLVSWSATLGIFEWSQEDAYVNQHIFKVVPDDSLIEKQYLKHVLKMALLDMEKHLHGATMKHVNRKEFLSTQIPLPPLDEQKRIAAILDKADQLRNARRQAIAECDKFLKSTFIEMFGDPVTNSKGWEEKKVIDVCDCIVPGRDKPKSFTGKTPWITTEDLMHLGVTCSSNKQLGLSADEISQVKARVIPQESVLMTCVGDLGVVSINRSKVVVNQQLHSFQCKTINNFFMMFNLSMQKSYMYKMASSTTVPYMNKTVCNNVPVILPPLPLQNKFAEIVKQTEAMKERMKASERELDDNFNSLMQRAFKGEL